MSETPKHRGDTHGPRHAAQEPDDPARIDLDELFPGTKATLPQRQKHRQPRPKRNSKAAALAATAATGTIAIVYAVAQAPTTTVRAVAAPVERTAEETTQPSVQTGLVELVTPDSPRVTTEAAPPPPPPKPAPVAAPATPAPVAVAAPAPLPKVVVEQAAPAPAVDKGAATRAAIVTAAYAQIGESQDCVKMVSDALATVGIRWYDWPVGAYNIGYAVPANQALPGDLIYYVDGTGTSLAGLAHIAVYVGNGMAVHGGWDGWTTKLFSVNVGSGPNYIRVT